MYRMDFERNEKDPRNSDNWNNAQFIALNMCVEINVNDGLSRLIELDIRAQCTQMDGADGLTDGTDETDAWENSGKN